MTKLKLRKILRTPLEYTLWYHRKFGWAPIPMHIVREDGRCSCRSSKCSNPGKHPYLASWAEFQQRRPTEDEIRRWWTQWPEAGIAIVCGRVSGGLVALDIDDRKTGDLICQQHLQIRMERSPRYGLHVFVKANAPTKTCVLTPGIAELKGEGGLITVFPSPRYTLLRTGQPLLVEDPREWAVELLRKVGVGSTPSPLEKSSTPIQQGGQIAEGARNTTLTSIGGFLRQKGLDAQTIGEMLSAANQSICSPPLPDAEVLGIAKSVSRYAPQGFDSVAVPDISATKSIWTTAKALAESQEEDVKWLWDAYVGRGLITLISSMPKVGKTTLLFYLLRSLLKKEAFLGRSVTPPRKVLLLTEEPTNLLRRRIQYLGLDDEKLLIIFQYMVHKWQEALSQIRKAIVEAEVDLVVIDTLGAFWEVGDENDASKVAASLKVLQDMARKNATAMVLIHHLRKSGGEEGTAHRGSGQLLAAVDIGVEVYRVAGKEQQRQLKTVSRAFETPSSAVIELDKDGGYRYMGTEAQANRDETRREILNVIPQANDEPLKIAEIYDAIKELLSPQPSMTLVKGIISELVDSNFVNKFGNGKRGNPFRYKKARMSPKARKQRGLS